MHLILLMLALPIDEPGNTQHDTDRWMEATMLQLMLTTLQDDLQRMQVLQLPEQRSEIGHLAHRIAGCVRIARQNALAEACLQLEAACQNNALSVDDAVSLFTAIKARLEAYLLQLQVAETLADVPKM